MFQCAESILKADSGVSVQGHSPDSVRNGKRCRVKNALCNKTTDTRLDSARPNLLQLPIFPIHRQIAVFFMNGSVCSGPSSTLKRKRMRGLKKINMPVMCRNKTGQSGVQACRRPTVPHYCITLLTVQHATHSVILKKRALVA
ncbi:hypothetical protein QL093DRAFT_1438244 [Fusarium oxysporum]|nr:hypothetical protein QL093DRAFT_1438244 [Fusarium oxysporum]